MQLTNDYLRINFTRLNINTTRANKPPYHCIRYTGVVSSDSSPSSTSMIIMCTTPRVDQMSLTLVGDGSTIVLTGIIGGGGGFLDHWSSEGLWWIVDSKDWYDDKMTWEDSIVPEECKDDCLARCIITL